MKPNDMKPTFRWDDPILLEECFIRPALAERLTRSFFQGDRLLQAGPHSQAEQLREAIRSDPSGRAIPTVPRRVELRVIEQGASSGAASPHRLDEAERFVQEVEASELDLKNYAKMLESRNVHMTDGHVLTEAREIAGVQDFLQKRLCQNQLSDTK